MGAAVLTLAMLPAGPALAGSNPAGNNGTVKIDGVEFDSHPDNEPHVGCDFQVDFYGFDTSADASVTFEKVPPTGDTVVLTDDSVALDGDDNSGGGSVAGLDAEADYRLGRSMVASEPHAKHGYHVHLTVEMAGPNGVQTKHKTFWVTACDEAPPPEL
jgi:hypothetical protein